MPKFIQFCEIVFWLFDVRIFSAWSFFLTLGQILILGKRSLKGSDRDRLGLNFFPVYVGKLIAFFLTVYTGKNFHHDFQRSSYENHLHQQNLLSVQ